MPQNIWRKYLPYFPKNLVQNTYMDPLQLMAMYMELLELAKIC